MSKNQIWVLIAIVAIGVLALVSDVKIKVEVGTEDYANLQECHLREAQACPNGSRDCTGAAYDYSESLGLPDVLYPD